MDVEKGMMTTRSRTRKHTSRGAAAFASASAALFSGVAVLSSISTTRVTGPEWVQKKRDEAEGKEEENEEK